jgi:hypothetical protein
MLFGARTERKRDVLAKAERTVEGSAEAAIADDGACAQAMDPPPADESTSLKSVKSRRGHGRIAASSYEGASLIELACASLHPGDRCPQCERGRVYDSSPRTIVMVKGQPPLVASIYKLERLRCRLCDAVYSANLPPEVAERPKYDASCASMLAVLRYGCGMPLFRLQELQRALHTPLPDATQWDILSKALAAPRAVFDELKRRAAQAPLLHSDDTPMKVLSLMAERAKAEKQGLEPERKAINTSGIVAVLQHDDEAAPRRVVLFFTGHAHAGHNMEQLLAQRVAVTAATAADVRRVGRQHERRIPRARRTLPRARPQAGHRHCRALPRSGQTRDRGPGQGLRARCCLPRDGVVATAAPDIPPRAQPADHGWLASLDERAVRAATG